MKIGGVRVVSGSRNVVGESMSNRRQRAKSSESGPVLAAAVGLGEITIDAVVVRPGRTLTVGGGRSCDLPFTCDASEIAFRDGDEWVVGVPDGASIPGASEATRVVRLQDWNPGVTITDGDAWLRVWPSRGEAFAGGPGAVQAAARGIGRGLPLAWLALSLTLAVATAGVWATGALAGSSGALALGEGGGGALIPERFATFGDGELGQPGEPTEVWVALPEPDDAVAETDDETETETEIERSDDSAEAEIEREPRPEDTAALEDDALAVATPVAEPDDEPAAEPADAASVEAAKAAAHRGKGAAGAGASGFGFGGGTDDGFADRHESIESLEYLLASCMEGRHTHKLTLAVDTDGRLKPGSLDYAQGWTPEERACVAEAVQDWAFPAGDDAYEVSLRVRKARGGHA